MNHKHSQDRALVSNSQQCPSEKIRLGPPSSSIPLQTFFVGPTYNPNHLPCSFHCVGHSYKKLDILKYKNNTFCFINITINLNLHHFNKNKIVCVYKFQINMIFYMDSSIQEL